jgi:hypothetical protein
MYDFVFILTGIFHPFYRGIKILMAMPCHFGSLHSGILNIKIKFLLPRPFLIIKLYPEEYFSHESEKNLFQVAVLRKIRDCGGRAARLSYICDDRQAGL